MNELVIMKDKQAVTSSLQVAESFNKNHQHVLRSIDGLKKMCPILDRCLQKPIYLILMVGTGVDIT